MVDGNGILHSLFVPTSCRLSSFFFAICRQTNHVGLCVLSPSSPWIIGCRVQSDPEHHPVCLVHGQACVSTHCLWACSYTPITGNTVRGAERQACCVHMTAQCCGRRRVRDEKPRESGGSDAEQGKQGKEAVNIRGCVQRRVADRQIDSSRQWVRPKKWLLTQQSTEGSG